MKTLLSQIMNPSWEMNKEFGRRSYFVIKILVILLLLIILPGRDVVGQSSVIVVETPSLTPSYNGCSTGWVRLTNNRGHYFYLTANTNRPSEATNSGVWRPNLPSTGQYKVEAYISTHNPLQFCGGPYLTWDTADAHYTIFHANGSQTVSGNQKPLFNQWLNLGTYSFNAGTAGYVKLTDLNDEAHLSHSVSFSAMRFTYIEPPTPTYSISGRITDGINPIAAVTVTDGAGHTTTTDSNGYYTFTGLTAGNYTITPDKDQCTMSPPFHPISVPPDRDHLDFVTNGTCSQKFGNLQGRITQSGSGAKINGARVSIGGRVTFTNSQGDYYLDDIPVGTHNLYVTRNGYKSYRKQVTIVLSQTRNHNVALTRLGNEGFRLPFPTGKTYRCSQGNNGPYSHIGKYAYAYDWSMTTGRTVVATRDGYVKYVKENSYYGGCSSRYRNSANYVAIQHSDGTITWYVHLKAYSVPVRVGQFVRSGQIIGKVGLTGWVCGAHLHADRRAPNNRTIRYPFLDVSSNNGIPQTGRYYKSGNLSSSAIESAEIDITPPEGNVSFELTGSSPHKLKLSVFDYHSEQLQMRTAGTLTELQTAAWHPYTDTINSWADSKAWVQYKDETNNVSEVYSDTIDPIGLGAIQASFNISDTACVDAEVQLTNQTDPFCEQCGWHWDFGNNESSKEAEPVFPDLVYPDPGNYTVTLTTTAGNNISTDSHQVTILPSPDADFTISRSDKTITVVANADNATEWRWDFSDGTTTVGRTATHTYTLSNDSSEQPVVRLTVTGSNGCSNTSFQYVDGIKDSIFLPLITR